MAPQTDIPVAANVLGTIGTGMLQWFWCIQLIPQIWTNWRTKQTEGLPAMMMFLWGVCGVPLGTYAVLQNFNVPIQVQPQVFMALCLISWIQILVYGHAWAVWRGVVLGFATAGLFAGAEAALILTLRPVYNDGHEAPALVVGILGAVLLAAGLLPPYFEIYKRRGRVVGINFFFLGMDWCGAFFSLMAVVAQNTFDVLGGVQYILCAMLEIGIFSFHFVWWLRTRKLRQQARAEGKTFDELAAERVAVEGDAFPFAERPLHPMLTSAGWSRAWNAVLGRRPARAAADDGDAEAGKAAGAAPAAPAETVVGAASLQGRSPRDGSPHGGPPPQRGSAVHGSAQDDQPDDQPDDRPDDDDEKQ